MRSIIAFAFALGAFFIGSSLSPAQEENGASTKPTFRTTPAGAEVDTLPALDNLIPPLPPPENGAAKSSASEEGTRSPLKVGSVGFKNKAPVRVPFSHELSIKRSAPILTLEAAYERAFATEESIRIAYLNTKKARLVPRTAFYAFLPTLRADLSYRDEHEHESRTSSANTSINRTLDRRPLETTDAFTAAGTTSNRFDTVTENSLETVNGVPQFQNSLETENRSSNTLANTRARTISNTASRRTRLLQESRRDRTRTSIDSHTPGFGLTFTQPLVDMTVFPAYRIGRLGEKIAQLQQQATARQVLFNVTMAYYSVLKLQRIVAVDEETFALTEAQSALAQMRERAGEVIRTDVLQSQVAVESARRNILQTRNLLEEARETLANILSLNSSSFRVVEAENYAAVIPPVDVLLERALEFREDYKVSNLNIETDIQRRNEVKAGYYPTVEGQLSAQWLSPEGSSNSRLERDDLQRGVERIGSSGNVNTTSSTGSALDQLTTDSSFESGGAGGASSRSRTIHQNTTTNSFTTSNSSRATNYNSPYFLNSRDRSHSSDAFDSSNTRWEAIVSVNLPIFDIVRLDTEMATASYQIMQTQLVREQLAATIRQQVIQAWRTAHVLEESVVALRVQVTAAEQAYRDLQQQYRVGAAMGIDVSDALVMLSASRRDLAVLNYDYQVALRNLEHVTGVFQQQRVLDKRKR